MEFQFDSMAAWWAMSGHGPYVWFCYGLALLVVLGNWFWIRRARRLFVRDAQARLTRLHTRAAAQRDPQQPSGTV